jgi:WD40 repeat protein
MSFFWVFLEVSVCSVASRNGYCVAGTRDSEIYGFELNGNPEPQLIVQGHHDNNLNALACHPLENIFATGGDDCSLRFDENKSFFFFENRSSFEIDSGMQIKCQ